MLVNDETPSAGQECFCKQASMHACTETELVSVLRNTFLARVSQRPTIAASPDVHRGSSLTVAMVWNHLALGHAPDAPGISCAQLVLGVIETNRIENEMTNVASMYKYPDRKNGK